MTESVHRARGRTAGLRLLNLNVEVLTMTVYLESIKPET